jgi:hypothetical protein
MRLQEIACCIEWIRMKWVCYSLLLPAIEYQKQTCDQGEQPQNDTHALEAQTKEQLQPYKDQVDCQ